VAGVYVPRSPTAGVLHAVVRAHLSAFIATIAARTEGSGLPPFVAAEFNLPNPGLGPEEILSIDAGVKLRSPRLAGEVFGFWSRVNDKIEEVATGALTPSGRRIVRNENLGSVAYHGVEAALSTTLTYRVEAFANLTWTIGEERQDGVTGPADRVPPVNGRVGVLYRPWSTVILEPFVQFAGPQNRLSERDLEDPRIDPDGTTGWVTANVRLRWALADQVRVLLGVGNVLNRGYREPAPGSTHPALESRPAGRSRSREEWGLSDTPALVCIERFVQTLTVPLVWTRFPRPRRLA
jgi:outer membrane receptor protein involved in Fe transport